MTERQGGESKKRRRAYEKDDEEFQIDRAAPSRRKSTRKPKEKKPFDPGSPNGAATPLLVAHPIPLIPMHNIPEFIEEEDMRECGVVLKN